MKVKTVKCRRGAVKSKWHEIKHMWNVFKYKNVISLVFLLKLVSLIFPSYTFSIEEHAYSSQISLKSGYHFYRDSNSWVSSREKSINEDLFFRDEYNANEGGNVYYSNNVDLKQESLRNGLQIITLEYIKKIDLNRFPILGDIEFIDAVSGLRGGASITYYMDMGTGKTIYSGPVIYRNTQNSDEMSYHDEINVTEKLLVLSPMVNLFYFYDRGFSTGFLVDKIVPYGGFEMGMGFINFKRTISLKTDPVYKASEDQIYQVSAEIQESGFNNYSFRFGIIIGGQLQISGPFSIDLRTGFLYQETSVTLNRSGTWNESINSSAYSRKVGKEKREAVFSQTGFYFSLGFTLGLQ